MLHGQKNIKLNKIYGLCVKISKFKLTSNKAPHPLNDENYREKIDSDTYIYIYRFNSVNVKQQTKLLQAIITKTTLFLQVELQTRLNPCIFRYTTNFTPVSFIHYFCSLGTECGKETILGLPMLFSIFVTSLLAAFSSYCQLKLQCRKGI